MNSLDKKYTDLLQDILDNGVTKETRNGQEKKQNKIKINCLKN
jgi:hypothetical protein